MSNTAWINDYLGEFAADATDEQKTAIAAAAAQIDDRFGEDGDDREQALSGAVQVILGDSNVPELARARQLVQGAANDAYNQLKGAIIAAHQAGESEYALTAASGVTRVTIRKILGK